MELLPKRSDKKAFLGTAFSKAKHIVGGWFNDQTGSESTDPYNPHETKITDYRYKQEPAFYNDRSVEYDENSWYAFLVDWLTTMLFDGLQFDGPGAPAVRKFFEETCPDAHDQVRMMGLNVVREGTGGLRKVHDGNGELRQISAMNGRLIQLREVTDEEHLAGGSYSSDPPFSSSTGETSIDVNVEPTPGQKEESDAIKNRWLRVEIKNDPSHWKEDLLEYPRLKPEDYINDQILLCRLRRDPRSPYGIAFGRACFHDIKALKHMNRDVIAGLKRLAATLLVLKADLSQYSGDDKRTKLIEAVSNFDDMDSASTGVLGIDAQNDIGYPTGSRTERLLPIMDHLEPVLSSILMNFLFAIGLIEQTGANKSLIAKQVIYAEKQLRAYQRVVSRIFATQLFPEITSEKCTVKYDNDLDPEFWMGLWETSAVSRERVTDEFSIIDEGKTYANDLAIKLAKAAAVKPTSTATGKPSGGSNSDDKGVRKGGKANTSVQKGR